MIEEGSASDSIGDLSSLGEILLEGICQFLELISLFSESELALHALQEAYLFIFDWLP